MAAAFLSFLVARFDVDLGETARSIRGANPWLYVLALASYYASFIARGARWRLMASNVGVHRVEGGRLPSLGACSLMILLGWFANSIGWLRVGDAYRGYVFAEASRSSFSQSLGIIVAERVIDVAGVFALLLLAAGGLLLSRGVEPSATFLAASLVLALIGAAALLLMARYGHWWSSRLPARWREAYAQFHQGAIGGFKQVPLVGALTVLGWLLEVGRLYLVVQALGFSLGVPMVVFVALANAVLTTVPLTPGGVGVVEPGVVGLLVLTVPRSAAVSIILIDRSISYLSIIVFGAAAFLIRQAWRNRGTSP